MKPSASIVALGLLLAAATAFGQTAGETVSSATLHCWLGADGAPYFARKIRCIADRELRLEELPDMESPTLVDLLHRELHFGSAASTEKMFKANIERVRESGEVWTIRIFNEPYESSWAEERPQRLVDSVLCPVGWTCTVLFTR